MTNGQRQLTATDCRADRHSDPWRRSGSHPLQGKDAIGDPVAETIVQSRGIGLDCDLRRRRPTTGHMEVPSVRRLRFCSNPALANRRTRLVPAAAPR